MPDINQEENAVTMMPTHMYKAIVQAAPDAYLILTPALVIAEASESYAVATMTKRDSIVGRHLFDVFPDNPDDPHADGVSNLRASLDRVLQNAAMDIMPIQKYDIPVPVEQGGGFQERYWSPRNCPVLDASGAILCIIHRVEDVTELVRMRRRDAEALRQAEDSAHRLHTTELELADIKQAQLLLRKSMDRLEMAQAIGKLGDWEYDLLTQQVSWSAQMYKLFDRDPALGPAQYEESIRYFAGHDRVKLEKEILRCIDTGDRYYTDVRVHLPTGREAQHLVVGVPVQDAEGRTVKLVGVNQDITDRKRVEEEVRRLNATLEQRIAERTVELETSNRRLQASLDEVGALEQARNAMLSVVEDEKLVRAQLDVALANYTDLYDCAPAGYMTLDSTSGNITQLNLAAAIMLGIERTVAVGQPFWHFVRAEDWTALRNFMAGPARGDVFKSFVDKVFNAGSLNVHDVVITSANGLSVRTVRMEPVLSQDGQSCRTTMTDITELVMVQQQGWQAKKEWETSVDAVSELIVVVDEMGVLTRCNKATAEYFRQPYQNLIGHEVAGLFAAMGAEEFRGVHELDDYEMRMGSRSFLVRTRRIKSQDGRGFVFVLWDVTERRQAEERLMASKQLVQTTLDSLDANICVLDSQGVIVAVNRSWREFGAENDARMGSVDEGVNYLTLCDNVKGVDAQDAQAFACGLRDMLAGRRYGFIAEYACHSPTQERWFVVQATLSRVVDQNMIVLAHRNVTEQRRAELALRKSEWTLRTLLQGTTAVGPDFFSSLAQQISVAFHVKYVCVGMLEGGGGRPKIRTLSVWANGALGANVEYELAGTPCETVVGQTTRLYERNVAKLFPCDAMLAEMQVESYIGVPLFGSDGSALGVLAALDSVPMRPDSAMESILGIFAARAGAEIQRQQVQQALVDSQQSLVEAQQIARVGSWEFDLRTSDVTWSAETYTIFDLENTPQDKLYAAYRSRLSPADLEQLDALVNGAVERGEDFVYEHPIVVGDGSQRYVVGRGRVIRDSQGIPRRVHGTCQDITEVKVAQQTVIESMRLRALSEIASGAAHDFNNILQGIGLNLELARINAADPAGLDENLTAIQQLVSDAAQRIRSLHSTRASGTDRQVRVLDAGDLLRDVAAQLQPLVQSTSLATGQPIALHTEIDSPTCIEGNAGELRSVFYNLVKNSVEAMPAGGTVTLSARVERPWVVFVIADTGIGMSEQEARRLFEPFFSSKAGSGGMGLGMLSVRAIIQAHGGTIALRHSTPGVGTAIEICLPRSERAAQPEHGMVQADTTDPARPRVLWVDDNDDVVRHAPKILAAIGYDGRGVSSAAAALDALAQESYDAVITDVGMPVMNGWQLADAIRRRYAEAVKIVVVSGWGERSLDMEGANPDLVDVILGKPLETSVLSRTLHDVLASRQVASSGLVP